MNDRDYTTIDGDVPVAANITDAKFNRAGGVEAVEVAVDIRPDGRALNDTLALRSRVDGEVLQEEPYEDRVEGVSVDPHSLPEKVEVSDVDASLGAEGAVLEILFGGEVVGTATRAEIKQAAQGVDGRVEAVETRVGEVEDGVAELRAELDAVEEETDVQVDDGGNDPSLGGVARLILDRLSG